MLYKSNLILKGKSIDMQHFLGSKNFPFSPYKIGARLLGRTRMVQTDMNINVLILKILKKFLLH